MIETNSTEWRAAPGFPAYEVSEDGDVRRVVPFRHYWYGRILKPKCNRFGYVSVNLYRDGQGSEIFVHRIVALAFHGPQPTPAHEVAHGDGNKKNNNRSNLRWATKSENCREKRELGELPDIRGEKHPQARLTDSGVLAMRERRRQGAYYREIAEEFGIPKLTAYDAITGATWSHI